MKTDTLTVTGGTNLNRVTIDTVKNIAVIDSAYGTAIRANRFYYGVQNGIAIRSDTIYSVRDTTKIMVADSASISKLKVTNITGTSRLTADTIGAVKLLNISQSAVSGGTDGDIWNETSHNAIHNYINGIEGTIPRVLFVQTDTKLDSNSTDETSLIGTSAVHALDSFPVRYFTIGKVHRFAMRGRYSTKATGPGTMTIRIKINATVLCSANVALDNNELDQQWHIEGYNVCVDTGATGKFRLYTGFVHSIAGQNYNIPIVTPDGGATINTTVKSIPDFTFQFSLADVSNKIKSAQFIIEELH
jgi:hypothetical protein